MLGRDTRTAGEPESVYGTVYKTIRDRRPIQAVYKGIRSDVEADSAEKLQYKGEERKHP
jgi:hypothetical protein